MKKRIFLAVAILAIGLSSASAQVVWGVRAGISRPTMIASGLESWKGKFGVEIGPTMYYSLKSNFYLNSGLMFSFKSFEDNTDGVKTTINTTYLELPINIGYSIPIGKVETYLQAGPYFGYNLSAKGSYADSGSVDIKDAFNSLNAGLGIMYGINIDRFKIEIGYHYGLTNVFKDDPDNVKLTSLFIGVGYVF